MAAKIDLRPVLAAVNPEEAVAFFRQKGFRIGFDYRDVWRQEHQAAFTVAKAMQIDLLQEIRDQVDLALAQGSTFAEFQKNLIPKLQARGWWGRQEQVDPADGVAKAVQLGSPKRLATIYDTNLATAYSEGQWERIQRNQALFPYLEYVRSASVNPRHTHLAYTGLVLRADDAFWQSHLPIKEWGCKCSVVQHSQRMLAAEGLVVGKAPPEVMRLMVNKRTGEVMQVPVGVDPAFHYPPGKRRAHLEKMLTDKLATAPPKVATAVSASVKAAHPRRMLDPATSTPAQAAAQMASLKDASQLVYPFGLVPPRAAERIRALTGVDVGGFAFVMTGDRVTHVLKSHGDPAVEAGRKPAQQAVAAQDFAHLPHIGANFDSMRLGVNAGANDPPSVDLRWLDVVGGLRHHLVLEVRTNRKRPRVALKTYFKVLTDKTGG